MSTYHVADVVGEVDEELLCGICTEVLHEPHCCREGHTFCKGCITTWLDKKKTCPIDREKLTAETLSRVRPVENMVQKLVVRCPNHKMDDGVAAPPAAKRVRGSLPVSPAADPGTEDLWPPGSAPWIGTTEDLTQDESDHDEAAVHQPEERAATVAAEPGCHWTGKLSLRDKHVADGCEFTKVTCSLEGCKASVARRGLAEHEASCECRPVPCEHCGSSFVQHGLKVHVRSCDAVEIGCPQKCGERFPRGKNGEHAGTCLLVKLQCPFAQHGCECEPLRRDFDKHQSEAAAEHSMLMNAKVAALERNGREDKEKLLELSSGLAALADPGYAEGTLRWKVTGMAAKIAAKEPVSSVGYGVVGLVKGAGFYHLGLQIEFTGTHMGIYVMHRESGCCKMPVNLVGSTIELIPIPDSNPWTVSRLPRLEWKSRGIETAGAGRGFESFLSLESLQRHYVRADDTIEVVVKVRIAHGPSVQTLL